MATKWKFDGVEKEKSLSPRNEKKGPNLGGCGKCRSLRPLEMMAKRVRVRERERKRERERILHV